MENLERAVVEVFGGCNYKCQMCPQTTGRGKDWTRKMTFDMFEDILDQLAQLVTYGKCTTGVETMTRTM